MGKLMTFGKVAIVIRSRDHNPPHFHVVGPGYDAQVGIDPVVVMAGAVPKPVFLQVEAWAIDNRAALVAEWNRVNPNFPTV